MNDTRHSLHGHTIPKKRMKSGSRFMHDIDVLIDRPSTLQIKLCSNHLQSVPHNLMQTPKESLDSGVPDVVF